MPEPDCPCARWISSVPDRDQRFAGDGDRSVTRSRPLSYGAELTLKEAAPASVPNDPGKPVKPGDPAKPGDPGKPGDGDGSLPRTGMSPWGALGAGLALIAFGLGV